MDWRLFTRVTPVAGISVVGLCAGLAVTACSSTTSSAAVPIAVTKSTASTPAAPASSVPAGTATPLSTPTADPTPSNTTPVDASSDNEPFVLWQCNTNKPQVKPTNYLLACGDGSDGLTGVHWTSWTPAGATGVGTEHLNNCIPNCGGQAESRFVDYPVKISLTGSYLAAQGEPFSYAKITLTYLAARPLLYIEVNGKREYTHPASWSPVLPEMPASH